MVLSKVKPGSRIHILRTRPFQKWQQIIQQTQIYRNTKQNAL